MSPVGWRLLHGLRALALAVLNRSFWSPDSLFELGTLNPVNPSCSTSVKDNCLVLAFVVDITCTFLYFHNPILTSRVISTAILSYNGWLDIPFMISGSETFLH